MRKWKTVALIACTVACLDTVFAHPANAAQVSAASSQMISIGNVVAGKTYEISVQGTADLYAGWNAGKGLTFTADGKPTYSFPAPYGPFYPNGLDYDPSAGPTVYGAGGAQKLMGSLLGSFTANPQSYSDYFAIGSSYQFTAAVSGPVYAKVNDSVYSDNGGSYTVSLYGSRTQTNVPEAIGFTYDALGRVIAVQHTGGKNNGVSSTYTLDPAGNRNEVVTTGAP